MKQISLALIFLCIGVSLNASHFFQLEEFRDGKYRCLLSNIPFSGTGVFSAENVSVEVKPVLHSKLEESELTVSNSRDKMALLRIRLITGAGEAGGSFWDGFEYHPDLQKTFIPRFDRYSFPAVSYHYKKGLTFIGFAPWTISSRFTRHCEIKDGQAFIYFDSYVALNPSEKVKSGFVWGKIENALSYTEAVEAFYNAWPEYFRPIQGTDKRLYGAGGYMRSSSDPENREYYQLEDCRRRGFDWEWYYNSYQKAGDFFPSPEYWNEKQGYKAEKSHASCDTPGTVDDWLKNHQYRTLAGNKTSALFYYYMQQYLNCELLKNVFKDSAWTGEDGKPGYKAFNWGDEGWSEYAWPGKCSSYGAEVRKDLALLWKNLDIAGFALDCVSGDQKYYGQYATSESYRAFDDNGKVFVLEGVAIAYNLDYTHKLPPKPGNKHPASVVNEPYHYLTIFHSDAAIHEMPPFEREDKIAPRKLQLGQKPYFWWTSFKIKDLLEWDKLTPDDLNKAITGVMDHVIMMSLRYGAVPSVIDSYSGFPDMINWKNTFVTLQRAGWRAAPYAWVDGIPGIETPWAKDAPLWVSRFGDANNSYIVISIPSPSGMKGKLKIYTERFGANGAVYADINGKKTVNYVSADDTVIDFDLKGHEPLVLRKIGKSETGNVSAQISKNDKGDLMMTMIKNNSTPVMTYEHAPVRFNPEPKSDWLSKLLISDGKKNYAAIIATEEGFEKAGTPARQLQIYMDYLCGRIARTDQPLFKMIGFFKPALRFPVFAPEAVPPSEIKTLFAIGNDARKKYFPDISYADTIAYKQLDGGRCIIGFFPGKLDESDLITAFLAELDKYYPFYGVITREWSLRVKMYGKTYLMNRPDLESATKACNWPNTPNRQ